MERTPANRLNLPFAQGVGRFGFRKWYERELLSSHAHLVLVLLSAVGIIGSLEAFRGASPAGKLMDVAFIVACAWICQWALRRYLYLLMRAEHIANQATCVSCKAYGAFVVEPGAHRDACQACCRKCEHRWVIDTPEE